MTFAGLRPLPLLGLLACALAHGAQTQFPTSATTPIVVGNAGYTLNFQVQWTCDDDPRLTTGATGRIDLLDGGGNQIGEVTATLASGVPQVGVQGTGAVSNAAGSVTVIGAGATPADASLTATWHIAGPPPGTYTLRYWTFRDATQGVVNSSITTEASDAGGSGPVNTPVPGPPVTLSPASASITAGQSVGFTASGGGSGAYTWGGAASGSGPAQTVPFPVPGTFTVSVFDPGNARFSPSAPATATVTVQPAFYTLSLTASGGGSVSGGGSYAPNALATAVATADPGETFAGWSGDAVGATPSLSIIMSSNKAAVAHFSALLAQTISFTAPRAVSTRTPAFSLAATASSGLPVSIALDSGPASLAAGLLTPSGATGTVSLTATQPGNAQYLPAPPVVLSFPIGPPPPGVILAEDAAVTKRSDRYTRMTSYVSGPAH